MGDLVTDSGHAADASLHQGYGEGPCRWLAKEATMTRNEGNIDRILRVVVGLGILSLAFIGPQSAWAYLGIVPVLTGLLGYCPAYSLLGISTCSVRK